MSITLENLIWELRDPILKGHTKLVLLALANYSDDDGGSIYPSQGTIALRAQISVRSVQYALARLEREGYVEIVVHRGRERANEYRINTQKLRIIPEQNTQSATQNTQKEAPKIRKTRQQNTQSTTQNTQSATQNTQSTTLKYANAAYNPPVTHQENHQGNHQRETGRAHAHEGTHEGTHEEHGGGGNGRALAPAPQPPNANTLRQFLATQIGPPEGQSFHTFEEFWCWVLSEYPATGKVDLDEAKEIAQGLDPVDWEEVACSVRNLRLSNRGRYVRNLPNFLRGRSWTPYKDGPLPDAPEQRAPTVREQKVLELGTFMGRAGQARAVFEERNGIRKTE